MDDFAAYLFIASAALLCIAGIVYFIRNIFDDEEEKL